MLIADFFASVDSVFVSFFSSGASRVATSVRPVFNVLVTLYVVLWGVSIWRGLIEEPMSDGITRILKIVLIGTFALNSGVYAPQIAQAIFQMPDELAGVLISGASTASPILSLGMLLQAIGVWVFTVILVGYAAALILLSKIGLSIVLALGPLFIALLLFEPTRQLFSGWLAQAINGVLTYVVAVAIVALGLQFFQSAATASLNAMDTATPQFTALFPLLIVGGAVFLTLMQSGAIASALAGGIQIGTLGGVGWALNRAGSLLKSPLSAYRGVRAMNDRRLNRDYLRTRLGMSPTLTTRSLQWLHGRIRGTNEVKSTG